MLDPVIQNPVQKRKRNLPSCDYRKMIQKWESYNRKVAIS